MITAGIDFGAKNVKVVILNDGEIVGKGNALTGFDLKVAAKDASEMALKTAGLKREDIAHITETGIGQGSVEFAADSVSEVGANAKAGVQLMSSARTIIDVGAEEGRGMRCDKTGKILDFEVNEKCAAGAGAFTEAMSRALEVKLEDLGALSLKATEEIPMNAQCTVFAESEVVTMVHNKVSKANMAKAVHDAMASRITSMVRKIGFDKDVVLVGGVANNVGFVDSLNNDLELKVVVPKDPEYVGALGAALVALEMEREK